jgi:hypothetical protein
MNTRSRPTILASGFVLTMLSAGSVAAEAEAETVPETEPVTQTWMTYAVQQLIDAGREQAEASDDVDLEEVDQDLFEVRYVNSRQHRH